MPTAPPKSETKKHGKPVKPGQLFEYRHTTSPGHSARPTGRIIKPESFVRVVRGNTYRVADVLRSVVKNAFKLRTNPSALQQFLATMETSGIVTAEEARRINLQLSPKTGKSIQTRPESGLMRTGGFMDTFTLKKMEGVGPKDTDIPATATERRIEIGKRIEFAGTTEEEIRENLDRAIEGIKRKAMLDRQKEVAQIAEKFAREAARTLNKERMSEMEQETLKLLAENEITLFKRAVEELRRTRKELYDAHTIHARLISEKENLQSEYRELEKKKWDLRSEVRRERERSSRDKSKRDRYYAELGNANRDIETLEERQKEIDRKLGEIKKKIDEVNEKIIRMEEK